MRNYLVIFIDGLPYELREKLVSLNNFSYKRPLTPGIGYSINIHAEIFSGLSADQIGFFNTWKLEPGESPFRKLKGVKGLLDNARNNRYLNRLFREAIKYIYRCDSLNIPYKFIDMFAPCGYPIYSEYFPAFKLLPGQKKEENIISGTDAQRYSLAREKIKTEGRLAVFFEELDGISHKFGLDSAKYKESLNRLNGWIGNLCDEFSSLYSNGDIVVFSDHGMSPVTAVAQLGLEEYSPLADLDSCIYFLDTTMLRVWYFDLGIKDDTEQFLNNKGCGKVLTEQERFNFGLTSRKWADTIFLLNEGYVFGPSFLEKGHPLAMHGYHPRLSWQKGIFFYSGQKILPDNNMFNTFACHNLLKEILNNGKS